MNVAAPVLDAAEAARALAILHPAGHTFELRVPNARLVRYNGRPDPKTGTAFGFFDSVEAALAALPAFEAAEWPGLYVSLNPVSPALLARAANRVKAADRKSSSTSDRDVERRAALLIDADPVRPADISATNEEHEVALERIAEIRWFLSELGWPTPISADSGNGGHLVYIVDLPAEDGGLVKAFLGALADAFDDGRVHVDRTVFNAARIVKLWGTAARKGDSTADRPHRMSRMLSTPAERELVTEEMLREATAALRAGQEEKPATTSPSSSTKGRVEGFDVRDFIARHFPDANERTWSSGTRWILDPCPFNSDHTGTSAAILQSSSGVLSFRCQHNGCAGLLWKDLREKYEPKAPRPAARESHATASKSGQTEAHEEKRVIEVPEGKDAADWIARGAPAEGGRKWTGAYDVAGILGKSGAGGPRFTTGIETLDERLTLRTQPANVGTPLGRIIGITGAPSAGKSLAAGQAARTLAGNGLRVVMLVLDEPREDAAERVAQGIGFRHAELNAEYPATVDAVRQKCGDLGLDLSIVPDEEADESEPTIEDAAEYLLSVPNEKGYVLVVDSLHRAQARAEREGDDQRTRIRLRMNALRKLTREHRDVLVIYTAEANRSSYASKDKSRRTSAVAAGAEGRDIEFGSNALLFLTREAESDVIQVELPKNKIGRKHTPFSVRLHEGSASLESVWEEAEKARADEKALRDEQEKLHLEEDRVRKVLAALAAEKAKHGLTADEIRDRARMNKKAVLEALARLCDAGTIQSFKPDRDKDQSGPVPFRFRLVGKAKVEANP